MGEDFCGGPKAGHITVHERECQSKLVIPTKKVAQSPIKVPLRDVGRRRVVGASTQPTLSRSDTSCAALTTARYVIAVPELHEAVFAADNAEH